jgi:hypothetical protein
MTDQPTVEPPRVHYIVDEPFAHAEGCRTTFPLVYSDEGYVICVTCKVRAAAHIELVEDEAR